MSKIVKINREKTICDVLSSKQAFVNNKKIGFKNPQNWHFSKGLVHGFGQKFEILKTFLCCAKYTQKKYLVTFSLENKPF